MLETTSRIAYLTRDLVNVRNIHDLATRSGVREHKPMMNTDVGILIRNWIVVAAWSAVLSKGLLLCVERKRLWEDE